jgi:phosphoglucosamine mutase
MTAFPQRLINVPVKNKPDFKTIPEITNKIQRVEAKLGREGRVLIRYSGTQPICRVMVEGPTSDLTDQYCHELSETIEEAIG